MVVPQAGKPHQYCKLQRIITLNSYFKISGTFKSTINSTRVLFFKKIVDLITFTNHISFLSTTGLVIANGRDEVLPAVTPTVRGGGWVGRSHCRDGQV